MRATQAGYSAFRREFDDPSKDYGSSFECTLSRYDKLRQYYSNEVFNTNSSFWEGYAGANHLYRHLRYLENPTEQLVEFYVANVYPGTISDDGLPDDKGNPSAIPFTENTDLALVAAIAQMFQWSNFQSLKSIQICDAAVYGNAFTEIVDDVERGQIYLDVKYPGFVKDLDLDNRGNVTMFMYEYPVVHTRVISPTQTEIERYTYGKKIDKKEICYYKDGELFDYDGYGARVDNPYSFVPATWTPFRGRGGMHGKPIIAGCEPLLDDLNGLLSMIIDKVEQVLRSPSILWGALNARSLSDKKKSGATSEQSDQENRRESVDYITGPAGGHRESLIDQLDFTGVDISVGRLLDALNKRCPELLFDEKIMEKSELSGIALLRLMSRVTSRLEEVQGNFDQTTKSLSRMSVAIAGERLKYRVGGWAEGTPQQMAFDGFDLTSYKKGLLTIGIAKRPLLDKTTIEVAQEEQATYTGVKTATEAGVPLPLALKKVANWTEEEIAELRKAQEEKQAQIEQDQMLANEDKIPQEVQ